MHNIKDLRKNLKLYKKKLFDRNFELDINEFEKAKQTDSYFNKQE